MKRCHFNINEYLVILYRFSVCMLFYTLLRVGFYLYNHDLFERTELGDWPLMIYGGWRFDISGLTYLFSVFVAVYILLFKKKYSQWGRHLYNSIFFITGGLGILLNCADYVYYRFVLKRTTFNVIDILGNEDNYAILALQFIKDYWSVALFFVVFFLLFVKVILLAEPKISTQNNRLYFILSIAVLLLCSGLSVAGIRGGFLHSTRPISLNNAAAYTRTADQTAIVLNTPFSIIRTIGKRSFPRRNWLTDDEATAIFNPVHTYKSDSTKRMNVVIFILESFSREWFGVFNPDLEDGNYRGYTPFLDSLAEQSYVFTRAYANGRKSIDAMPSILASIPSLTLPYIVSEYCNNRVNSLASILNDEGYYTAFFHGAPNGSMGFDGFARTAGFKDYFGKREYNNDEDYDGWWGIWDEKFFQYYAQQLNKIDQPFCCALFSLSSHHPFRVPTEFEGVFPKGNLPIHQCVGYTDYSLKCFFETAKNMDWYENTLFVITADHCTQPDHEEYANEVNSFAIPLIFYAHSDTTLRGKDNNLAQQTDIMPTILSYLGYNGSFISFGNNLFDENAERFVLNCHNEMYQIMKDSAVIYFDGENFKGENPDLERLAKSYIQQYNNRLIDNDLTIKQK